LLVAFKITIMSKKLVLEILQECVDQQLMANLGGIVGGEEEEQMAKEDLARYSKAFKWFKEKCK
jgi:hypothetical protein